jgi:pimeloyl-ACP methyl ester carboxylesterase
VSAPEQIQVEANGMTFGALAWGASTAPLALMVHGYPDTAWTWRHLGPYLAERGWRAVAPFTRGYGPTDLAPNDSYLIAELANDLIALHAALGGDDRAVLIGHDWGAVASWSVTDSQPARFARYVAMAVPPIGVLLRPWARLSTLGDGARQSRKSWYILFNQLPVLSEGSLDRVIPKLWRDWSPGYDGSEDIARVFESLAGAGRRRAALRYYRGLLQRGIVARFTVRPGAPALSLHGERDGCMGAKLAATQTDLLVPGSRFELIEGVGHFMQLEDPARVNALIGDWIGSPS